MAADFVTTAGQNTDNAKAQALNNIAQTGQSQSSAFGQAAQNDAAAKTAALKTAMAMAALRGAPAGNVQQGQSTISAPLNDRAATLGTIASNYAQNNAATKGAFGSYFDVTKAGLPIAEQRYKEQAGQLQEKAAERAAALASQAQAHADAHDLAVLRMQAAQDKANAAKSPTLGQFLTSQGGADLVGDQIKSVGDTAKSDALQRSMNDSTTGYAQGNDWYGDAVQGTPIPRSLADILVNNSQGKDVSQAGTTAAVEASPAYQSAAKEAEASFAAGDSYPTFAAKVAANVGDPVIAARLLSNYGAQFRTRDADARAAANSPGSTPTTTTTVARTQ